MNPTRVVSTLTCALVLFAAGPALAGSGVKKGLKDIRAATGKDDPEALETGMQLVIAEGGKAAAKGFLELLEEFPKEKPHLYWQVMSGLCSLNDAKALDAIGDFLVKKDAEPLAKDVMFGLQNNSSAGAVEVYRKILKKKGNRLHILACDRLGELETVEAVDLLLHTFEKAPEGSALARRVKSTLTALFGEDMGDLLNWQGWWEQNRATAFEKKGGPGGPQTGTVKDDLGAARKGALTMTRKGKVIVLRGMNKNFDSIEKMLRRLDVKHTVVQKMAFMAEMENHLKGVAAIILNCNFFTKVCKCKTCVGKLNPKSRLLQCSGCDKHDYSTDELSKEAVARIKKFVDEGGSVFTEDMGLTELTAKAWPDHLVEGPKLKAQRVDYAPMPGQAGTPLLRGVMKTPAVGGGSKTKHVKAMWKIDNLSPSMKIVDASKVRVLLASEALRDLANGEAGMDAVAVTFSPGEAIDVGGKGRKRGRSGSRRRRGKGEGAQIKGVVLLVLSHFGKQSTKNDEFTLQNLLVNFLLEAQERFDASKK